MSIEDRIRGAIIGCIVGDAAAQPSHWIYDEAALRTANAGRESTPEFGPPRGVFYRQEEGDLSAYGDQAYLVLKSIASHGKLDTVALAAEHAVNFGPGSRYDVAAKLGHEATKADWPIPGPWTHASIRTFLKNTASGISPAGDASDSQADGVAKIAPIVGLLAGSSGLLAAVDEATRLTQNNDEAAGFSAIFAHTLEAVIQGASIRDAVTSGIAFGKASENAGAKSAAAAIEDAVADSRDHAASVAARGSSCHMPESLANAIHCAISVTAEDEASADGPVAAALRRTVGAIGCNCSRACVAGALLGARVRWNAGHCV